MFSVFFKRSNRVRRSISPSYLVFIWFGIIIFTGSVLLWTPWAHVDGVEATGALTALFTTVSAACVTGLTVVNVGETYSFFGQVVIFLLLELGGLGIMTFAHLGFNLLGRRSSIGYQAATEISLFQSDAASQFKRSFQLILGVTLIIQLVGAALMLATLLPRHWEEPDGVWRAVWSAMFHTVSAFCNGGFSLYPGGLDGLGGNVPFLFLLLVLITLGGLGNTVLVELRRLPRTIRTEKKPRWLSLHTRVVLVTTACLLVCGVAGAMIFGVESGGVSSLGNEVFLMVSGRTAGFSTVPVDKAPLPTVLLLIALMFIGGSPGSCAGGIKTTSLAIWLARIKANLRHDTNVNLFGYTIAPDLVSRARILMALTMLWNLVGVFILVVGNPGERLETLVFEQVSAFGTVGLSMNFTQRLDTLSRLWIILSMFVGRLGPLSIALWVVPTVKAQIHRPVGRIMVG